MASTRNRTQGTQLTEIIGSFPEAGRGWDIASGGGQTAHRGAPSSTKGTECGYEVGVLNRRERQGPRKSEGILEKRRAWTRRYDSASRFAVLEGSPR